MYKTLIEKNLIIPPVRSEATAVRGFTQCQVPPLRVKNVGGPETVHSPWRRRNGRSSIPPTRRPPWPFLDEL